jgi:hypothetical protein
MAPMADDRRSWMVVARMHHELKRQAAVGLINVSPHPDSVGRVQISGTLDLAAFANATEEALREAFGGM